MIFARLFARFINWQACHYFRKCEYEYLAKSLYHRKCTNYRQSIFDLWTRVGTSGFSSHALTDRFFTWHIFCTKNVFCTSIVLGRLSFGKIWPVSRDYFSTNTCQVTLWHLCMTCLSDLLSTIPWWLKDNAVHEWICTTNTSRFGLLTYLHYGNTGFGVFKGWIQNQKGFLLKINSNFEN